jgi:plasmid stabilization system protein ParE
MALKIVWTKRAQNRFSEAFEFAKVFRTEKEVAAFIQKAFRSIELLSIHPELGLMEDRKRGIRGFLITPYHRVFYRYSKTTLTVLNIFDLRMDPQKKKF